MIGELLINEKTGNIESPVSLYQPSKEIKILTSRVRQDYSIGDLNQNKSWREFNDRSLLQVLNDYQMAFNNYIPPRSEDPHESWKAQTIRPLTRNKIISIAAHITATIVVPTVLAQNDKDENDRMSAQVMQELMRWVMDQTKYENTYLFMVIGAMVNPCVFMKADFVEAMQTIKVKDENGEMEKKDVVDEILSGFKTFLIPADEILIANFYEFEIQRQRFIIHRRYPEYDELEALWGDHEDFKLVRPGIRVFFDDDSGLFYEQKDDDLQTLGEEVTYYNRQEDTQLTYVNGILVTDKDQRIKHRDNSDKPKYGFAKTGYEPIDEKHFFYYKSAVSKLMPDQDVLDQIWNMTLDGSFLKNIPPQNIIGGSEEVDNIVVIPGASNYFAENTKVEAMNLGIDSTAGYNAIEKLEQSMSESSQDPRRGGQGGAAVTARQFVGEERNSRIQLGIFLRMISNIVEDFGDLMQDLIIQHMTVGQVEEITAGQTRMKFRTYLLPNQIVDGRELTKVIQFTDEFLGRAMTDEDELKESFKIQREEGGIKGESRIYKVNPALFSKQKFRTVMKSDRIIPRSQEFDRLLRLETYDRMILDPIIASSQESLRAVTRDFLIEPLAEGEADKYLPAAGLVTPQVLPSKGKPSNRVEQLETSALSGLTV